MALYKVLKVKDKELKLRLRAQDCVNLESKIGESPLNILMRCSEDKLPTVGFITATLQCSLQAYHHEYTMQKTFQLYDDMVDEGKEITDMIGIITEVFEVSGFLKMEKTEEEMEKEQEITQEKEMEQEETKIVV